VSVSRRTTLSVLLAVVLLLGVAVPAGTAVASHGTADGDCTFPLTVTDGTGTDVTVDEEPQRIIALGGSAAQTAWEVGASEKVVGIDTFSTNLEGASNVTVVSQGIGATDYEKALSQNPDLIVVAGNSYSQDVVTEFRDSDVPVYQMPNAASFADIEDNTATLGHLLGACDAAAETNTWMQERIDVVESAVSGESAPSLFYDLGAAQDSAAHYSVSPGSFVGSVISTAGTANIVANGNFSAYPVVSNEFILEQNPEWLLVTYTPPSTASEARAAVNESDVLSQTAAAQQGNVVAVNANHLNRPAPRVVHALSTLASTVHPQAYAGANATATPTDGGDGSGGVPGFGAGVAVAALLAVSLVLARRADQ